MAKTPPTGAVRAGDYMQTLNVLGYVHNREITNLPGQFLVQGSYNCFIKNTEKVESRMGYSVLGSPKTVNLGIHSSFDWLDISSGPALSMRAWATNLQVFTNGDFTNIYTLPNSNHLSFATWWNSNELIDVLLWADGSNMIFEWGGGITTIASATATTLTKQFYLSDMTIGFVNNGAGMAGSITRTIGGFLAAGFAAGQTLVVSGSLNNNGTYIIQSLTDTVILINQAYQLATEAAGASGTNVVIQNPNGSWEASRFLTIDAGVSSDRAVTIAGQKFTYTGGESTGTLTGVSPSPVAVATTGVTATQTVRIYQPSALTSYEVDNLFVTGNQLFVSSDISRAFYISKNTDFTDYSFTSPLRKPGEGALIELDACPTAFKEGPDTGKETPNVYISAGTSTEYRLTFLQQISTDAEGDSLVYETTPVKKLPTGNGSSAISQDACVVIKNATAFVTFGKTVDSLQNITVVPSPKSTPISDPIRDDMNAYDIVGAQGVYFDRMLLYTLPAEGVIIIYDYSNENFYWQPPMLIDVSRLAVIEINGTLTLCGHSANSNETYTLFEDGVLNDNGALIKFRAAFGYENYGTRFMKKHLDELATEIYMTTTTVVNDVIFYDYKGATGIKSFPIYGNNPKITFTPRGNTSEGGNPEGYDPEGSATDDIPTVVKVRVIHDTSFVDFYEDQRVYECDSVDGYFAIIARGENATLSENLPVELHQ